MRFAKLGIYNSHTSANPKHKNKGNSSKNMHEFTGSIHLLIKNLNLKMITTNSQDPNLLVQTYLFISIPLPKPYFLQYKPSS